MRRLILEEPWSAAALWSRRLAFFALIVGVMSVGLARSGLVDITAIFAVFGAAVIVAGLGLLLGDAFRVALAVDEAQGIATGQIDRKSVV